ncbi:MAG: LEA type 2 family protein [Bacteroidetes bacterium]|nr:LEA type 2 family protein [Bacteroidota bacterium]
MKQLVLISILFCLGVAKAETEYKDILFYGMENFAVEKKDGKVQVHFDYVIENPNWYPATIMPSSLALIIADQPCGDVQVENKIKLKAKTKAGYRFTLVGDASQFAKSTFSSMWNMMSGKGIDFTIRGKLKAGVFIFRPKWKVDYTYKMTFDEFLSFF